MQQIKEQKILDIKDLIYVMLKKAGIIFLFGLIFAFLLGGYKFYSTAKVNQSINTSNDSPILNTSEKLSGESDSKYSERVLNVNHANDLINSINTLNNQIENNRKYVTNSVFMKIDPENEAFTTVNLVISFDKNVSNGADLAIVSTYRQYIISGEYLTSVSDELDIKQGYISELINANYETSTNAFGTDDASNVALVSVTVIGPSIEFTEKIMDSVLENVDAKCAELNKSVISHTVTVAGRQSSIKVDTATRDRQVTTTYRFESLQQQINNYDTALDTVAAKIGVDKSNLYSHFANGLTGASQTASSPVRPAIKYAVVGFAFGFVIILAIITINYIYSRKFSTQTVFFTRFNSVNKIGVVKPQGKRGKYAIFIDRKSGDDNCMSVENSNMLLSANIKNLTADMKKVLFTGTAETSKIEKLVKDLGLKFDVKASVFEDPKCLESVSEYDGIIIVEQRKYSDCSLIAEEIKLIDNANTKLIGAIIL